MGRRLSSSAGLRRAPCSERRPARAPRFLPALHAVFTAGQADLGSPGCAVGSRHGRVRCVPSSPPLHRCGNCTLHPTPCLSQLRKPQGRWQRAQGGGRGGPGLGGLVVGTGMRPEVPAPSPGPPSHRSGSEDPRILHCLPLRLQAVRRPEPRGPTWPPPPHRASDPQCREKIFNYLSSLVKRSVFPQVQGAVGIALSQH